MRNYNQLQYEDRLFIEKSIKSGVKLIEIAFRLDKSLQTIYTELKRGAIIELDDNCRAKYSADLAQENYKSNKKRCGRKAE